MEAAKKTRVCPDCGEASDESLGRREFLIGVTTAAATGALWAVPKATGAPTSSSAAETAVKALFESLADAQKKAVCFPWDFQDKRGLLRTHVSNNWQITPPTVDSDFFNKKQRMLIHDVFKGVFNPEWVPKIEKQLKDDSNGRPWGAAQSIAIFGTPGSGKFEFVMTGRHMTIRADGNSESHVALGGPIFHGHAASGFNEKVGHPGNIFWHQAVLANKLFPMLDAPQQKQALVAERPHEAEVKFQGVKGERPGIPIADLKSDQKEVVQKVLMSLIEPYRKEDQEEVMECLKKQGGLDKCHLAFYKDGDIGEDSEWDNFRVEGPAFVWYFRGEPHVHIWIHVADDPSVPLNASG